MHYRKLTLGDRWSARWGRREPKDLAFQDFYWLFSHTYVWRPYVYTIHMSNFPGARGMWFWFLRHNQFMASTKLIMTQKLKATTSVVKPMEAGHVDNVNVSSCMHAFIITLPPRKKLWGTFTKLKIQTNWKFSFYSKINHWRSQAHQISCTRNR